MRDHYKEFFSKKLQKYGAKGLGQLGDKRSAFFKEINLSGVNIKKHSLMEIKFERNSKRHEPKRKTESHTS